MTQSLPSKSDVEERDDEGRMLYRSYALINFFARSDEDATALIKRAEGALNRLGNARRGEAVDAVLNDEVYKGEGDEPFDADYPWPQR